MFRKNFLLLFLVSFFIIDQAIALNFGGQLSDHGIHVSQTSDNGYVLCGQYQSTSNQFIYVVKVDECGTLQWSKITGQDCLAGSISQTPDGGYILMGSGPTPTGIRAMLLRLDAAGDSLWAQFYGNAQTWDHGIYSYVTPSGKYILGTFSDDIGPDNPIAILKTDTNGSQIWHTVMNLSGNYGLPSEIFPCKDAGFISASTDPATTFETISVSKIDSNGNVLFQKMYEDTSWDTLTWTLNGFFANGVCEGSDNSFLVVGKTDNFSPVQYDYQFYYMKLDSAGDSLWSKHLNIYNTSNNEMISARALPDSGFIMAGNTGAAINHVMLFRIDRNGDTLWTKDYGAAPNHFLWFMDINNQGGYVMIGDTIDSFGNLDVWLMITDSVGNVVSCGSVGIPEMLSSSTQFEVFPNPAVENVNVSYYLPQTDNVRIEVYDTKGTLVQTLVDKNEIAGRHQLNYSVDLPKGVYTVRCSTSTGISNKKIFVGK